MSERKRYAQVGLGGRSAMFQQAILGKYSETSELVGVCDNNEGRVRYRVAQAKEQGVDVKGYDANDFDLMIEEARPDVVIVTTRDSFHDTLISNRFWGGLTMPW